MKYLLVLLPFLTFLACDLEREVNINLPEYENQLVVECYLEAGKPYRLLLTESISYFDIPSLEPIDLDQTIILNVDGEETTVTLRSLIDAGLLEADEIPGLPPSNNGATVVITHLGQSDTLLNQLYVELDPRILKPEDTTDNIYFKFYNYYSPKLVTTDFDNEFRLSINDTSGRAAMSFAQFLPPVMVDSNVIDFNDTDTIAAFRMWFTDPPAEKNYYRRTLNKKRLFNRPRSTFAVDDRFFDGPVVFNTGFDFDRGDTLINTFYHISKEYHDFLETFDEAEQANGNPFGQPASILSNIDGGTGIFTTLSFVRDTIPVE